ncbi:MAG: D-aminoacyl-tRNA deacylase [Bacteroidota bacterium]|nr:D-aminoacyl-tRNA deacylase [Bacteroidota bacterium]
MRVVIQRVFESSVSVENKQIAKIGKGMLIFVAVEDTDTDGDIEWLSNKIVNLRIFDDENGVMNKSVLDVGQEILVVSQFTLFASTKKGNRPSYLRASVPNISLPMYKKFVQVLESKLGKPIPQGEFGALMNVSIQNDGPTTIIIDTKLKE